MRIEEEIKQKKFRSERHKATINIIYTANWLSLQHTQFFKQYGISQQQFNIMRILRGQYPNPASVNLLIDRMLDKMSNASRLVEKLRKKGLVERRECKEDRRQVDIAITKKGIDLLSAIDREIGVIEQKTNTITRKEAEHLNKILDKLRG